MKKRLVAGLLWALLCALLWGCGPQAEAGLPRRLSPTKQTENDNLRCFPLACANCRFFAFEGDLLMLTQEEGSATLSRYAGRQLLLTGLAQVPEDALLCPGAEIGCYSPGRQEYWALSQDLSGCTCFSLPQCTGAPLALEGKIYYCTPQGLMELDTQTLLHRTLRQQQGLGLSTLLAQRGLAVCTQPGSREQLCIRLEDGSLAQTAPEILGAAEFGSQERLCLRLGYTHCLYLGQRELALPLGWEFLDFVPGRNEVLVYQPREALALYDLSTGNRMAALPLPSPGKPEAVSVTRDGRVYVRYGELLYQWEPVREARQDSRIVITPLYTPQQPDTKGLAQCRQRGAFLENQYGARVLLNTDVLQAAPPGCVLEPEHLQLRVLGPKRILGAWLLRHFGVKVVMTWWSAIFATAVVIFPLMYRTARGAFEAFDETLAYSGQTLGLPNSWIFWRVRMPCCRQGILAGTVLAFARALGEYGATSMIAGYTPGKTATISTTVYQLWQTNNDGLAMKWVVVNLAISAVVLLAVNMLERRDFLAGGSKRRNRA